MDRPESGGAMEWRRVDEREIRKEKRRRNCQVRPLSLSSLLSLSVRLLAVRLSSLSSKAKLECSVLLTVVLSFLVRERLNRLVLFDNYNIAMLLSLQNPMGKEGLLLINYLPSANYNLVRSDGLSDQIRSDVWSETFNLHQ